MIVVAVVLSLLLGAAIYAIATHVGTTTRLAEAMAYGNTAEVAALHNLRLRGEDKAAAAKWLDAMAARDLLNRLEARMAENDTQEVAAILNCHGPSLPAARRDVAWDWIKLRAQDLARERLEYCMSRVDENGVRALLMVRGNLLTEAQRADAEAWLAEPYDDEADAQEDE